MDLNSDGTREHTAGVDFDFHSVLAKLPGLPWAKYPGEKHVPSYAYLGPGTRLDIRLDANDLPRKGEEPTSETDALALKHDIAYRNADAAGRDKREVLAAKHKADQEMVDGIDEVDASGPFYWLVKRAAQAALLAKLKAGLGVGTDENVSRDEARRVAKELHSRIVHKFPRRMVQVNRVDEIHAGDLMDFSKSPLYYKRKRYTYVLVNVDVFSKFCWCVVLPSKNVLELKWAFQEIWQDRVPQNGEHSAVLAQRKRSASPSRKPAKLWFDRERAIDSREFKEFLAEHNVELYHTYSEIKCSVAERMIRMLKEKCEKIKTEYELLGKPYNLIDVLPEVLREYNYTAIHSAHKMTPADASRSENEVAIQKHYQQKYDDYDPKNGYRLKVGDVVRIYKFKTTFEKGITTNWTSEKFRVKSVHDTRPLTYSIEDLNENTIEGKVYAWELRPSSFT